MTPREWPEHTGAARRLVDEARRAGEVETAPPEGARGRVWSTIEARLPRRAARFGWRPALLLSSGAFAMAAVILAARLLTAPSMAGRRFDVEQSQMVDVHGAARVVLAGGTRASILRDDRSGITFSLERGSLLADVNHRPAGAPFIVRAPRAEVKVVGTVLWVDVDDRGEATVLVGRGAVEVTPIGIDEQPVPRARARVGEAQRWPEISERSPTAPDVALLAAAGGPEGAPRFAPPAPLEDPLRAESALYERGWRQLRDQGDARAALTTWSDQRRRFPNGVLRPEADVSIIQAAIKLDERALARREIEANLTVSPDSLAAPELHFLLGTLDRAEGNCPAALAEFDLALKSPADPWAAEARAQRTACQRR